MSRKRQTRSRKKKSRSNQSQQPDLELQNTETAPPHLQPDQSTDVQEDNSQQSIAESNVIANSNTQEVIPRSLSAHSQRFPDSSRHSRFNSSSSQESEEPEEEIRTIFLSGLCATATTMDLYAVFQREPGFFHLTLKHLNKNSQKTTAPVAFLYFVTRPHAQAVINAVQDKRILVEGCVFLRAEFAKSNTKGIKFHQSYYGSYGSWNAPNSYYYMPPLQINTDAYARSSPPQQYVEAPYCFIPQNPTNHQDSEQSVAANNGPVAMPCSFGNNSGFQLVLCPSNLIPYDAFLHHCFYPVAHPQSSYFCVQAVPLERTGTNTTEIAREFASNSNTEKSEESLIESTESNKEESDDQKKEESESYTESDKEIMMDDDKDDKAPAADSSPEITRSN